jgi:DNA-directed RNA polymerase specialized sigma24 family protein
MEARVDRSFEIEWPEIARWLRGALARRGVPFGVLDDVIQETGCRLWKMWDRVDESRSTRALAIAIASNYVMDEYHRRRSAEPVEEVPEVVAQHDVEEAGLASLELARIKRAFKDLSESHRQILLAEIGDAEPPEASPAALKMLRLRARRRLHLILNSTSAGYIGLTLKLKEFAWKTQNGLRRSSTAIEVPGGVVATLAVAALALGNHAFLPQIAEAHSIDRGSNQPVQDTRSVDRNEWFPTERQLSSPPARQERRAPQREERPAEPTSESIVVGHEEGPISAGAGITWHPVNEGEDELEVPDCSVDPSRQDEVRVRCSAKAGDRHYDIDVTIALRP